jgi:hypothetical protein
MQHKTNKSEALVLLVCELFYEFSLLYALTFYRKPGNQEDHFLLIVKLWSFIWNYDDAMITFHKSATPTKLKRWF